MTLASAIHSGDVDLLPGKRDEDWRWTDLRGLIRVLPPSSPAVDIDLPPSPFGITADAELAFVNGRARAAASYTAAGGKAVLALRFVSATPAGAHAAEASILVPTGAHLTVLESYEGLAEDYLTAVRLDFTVQEGASLERIILVDDDAEAVSVSDASVDLARGASFGQTVVTGGARRQRVETRLRHPGGHASARLDGAYILSGKRHADLTTVVDHQGLDGTTDQLTKGVAGDQSRAVFQGRIVVAKGADRTDARMGHHALILSDRAEVDAKPELEIYADDVSCAHGATVGALDDEALFYAAQRGIPEPAGRAMLTAAFIGEVIDRIGHEAAREAIRTWAAERLEG